MDFRSNLHTHTQFSDGKNSPEEYVQAAIEKGFISLGFSEHAPMTLDGKDREGDDFVVSMRIRKIERYYQEISALKEAYRDQIQIYIGMEDDFMPPSDRSRLDYLIGSVHYVKDPDGETLHTIDHLHENFLAAIDALGSSRAVVEAYYRHVAEMAETFRPDIVGHFDLICKMNSDGRYFDSQDRWYQDAVVGALERIAVTGCMMEINTGGMSRGYVNVPYPSLWIMKQMNELHIPITISSDCHQVENLNAYFDEAILVAKNAGYRGVKRMNQGSFEDVEIG